MINFKENDIIFLLGAGASVDAGIPISSQMVNDIEKLLTTNNDWKNFKDLYFLIKSGVNYSAGLTGKNVIFNIETLLYVLEELVQKEKHLLYPFIGSWNIRFNEVVKDNFKSIEKFQTEIKKKLKEWVTKDDYREADYFKHIKSLKDELTFPLRIFTLNYDKCIEANTNNNNFKFTYERGFEKDTRNWNHKRFIERIHDDEPDIYLYKLHGSIDWKRDKVTSIVQFVDREPPQPDLIFGTQNKLQYSDPYLFLFSQFRHYTLNAKLIVCIGYSFSDEHINELIRQALKQSNNTKLLSVMVDETNDTETLSNLIANNLDISQEQIIIENNKAKEFFENKLNREYFSNLFPESNNEDDIF